jgi:formylglycine-generating enzyme required for sulfatase activity
MNKPLLALIFLILLFVQTHGQDRIKSLKFDQPSSLKITEVGFEHNRFAAIPEGVALYSVMIDSVAYSSAFSSPRFMKDEIRVALADSLEGVLTPEKKFSPGLKYTFRITNLGKKARRIENLVPLGEGNDKVYITAGGTRDWPQYLCRSRLYRPGYGPVGVVLPDNAWHLGFADCALNDSLSLTGLARRTDRDKNKTEIDRWRVSLKQGGWVEYSLYFDIHSGDWHEGLKMMFQQRWLYDLATFDNALFKRLDLGWMRNTWIMLLQFAWDKKYYDYAEKKYNFYQSFHEYDALTGGYDIFTIWPTWPRLGLDQRNQWDMYRDLPGGLNELQRQAAFLHKKGKKFFISYNPWDESTRKEDQFIGMEELLRQTGADGVVLDTRGESSRELQATADRVKPGIIMYSEGMAVPKDMPGIVSGRVHDALVQPPPLNLNKFIKPDFAIFRVLQLADDRLHREIAIAFFNGYGVEINTMRPGRPTWINEEFAYLGRTTKLLRDNHSVFHNDRWIPLIPTFTDSVYVNRWQNDNKTLFTIFSLKPEGFDGLLFELTGYSGASSATLPGKTFHVVDLWNHREIDTIVQGEKILIPVMTEPFSREWLGTRREGTAGCIAVFPEILKIRDTGDTLSFSAGKGTRIVLTGENPDYRTKSYTFSSMGNEIPYWDYFSEQTEKIVIQLFDSTELIDERVIVPVHNQPLLISRRGMTSTLPAAPSGMVEIPAGTFLFYTKRDDKSLEPFIPLPDHSDTVEMNMPRFYMDQYPVTNQQFRFFLKKTFYVPRDTSNFLKHWVNSVPPEGQADFPVVYINIEDAKAYARWAEKRLPTETEWQYAAQGTDMRKYPWGDNADSTRCNYNLNHPTPVDAFPSGASPFGVMDMVGNVWQMTGDVYDNGCYYFNIIRGGSYYHPASSIWYVLGGPLPADHPEMLLLMAPGLDRNATVGFRCVKDAR